MTTPNKTAQEIWDEISALRKSLAFLIFREFLTTQKNK